MPLITAGAPKTFSVTPPMAATPRPATPTLRNSRLLNFPLFCFFKSSFINNPPLPRFPFRDVTELEKSVPLFSKDSSTTSSFLFLNMIARYLIKLLFFYNVNNGLSLIYYPWSNPFLCRKEAIEKSSGPRGKILSFLPNLPDPPLYPWSRKDSLFSHEDKRISDLLLF